MKNPFFSIIVPTFNRENQLQNAIQSLLSQTFKNFEVIIVDDGSTDNTKALGLSLAANNPNIRYMAKENEERSIARNYGIHHARGRYIGFLDSDDVLYPNHLQTAFNLIEKKNGPEVVHLGFQLVDESGNVLQVRNSFDASFKEHLIHENILHGNAIFIRHDVATNINFIPSPDATVSEDWYLWLRLAARFNFSFDNTITSSVINHPNRSLLNVDPDKLIRSTEVVIAHLKKDPHFLTAYNGRIRYHFSNHYTLVTLILALTKKRRRDTLKYLAKAISIDPFVIFRRRFLASLKHLI